MQNELQSEQILENLNKELYESWLAAYKENKELKNKIEYLRNKIHELSESEACIKYSENCDICGDS